MSTKATLTFELDLSHISAVLNHDSEKIRKVLCGFIDCLTEDASALESAVSNLDNKAIRLCAHKLKGAAFVVGAKELAQVCGAIEVAADNNNQIQIRSDWPQFLSIVDGTREFILNKFRESAV